VTRATVQSSSGLCFSTENPLSTMVSLGFYKEKLGLKNKLKSGAHTPLQRLLPFPFFELVFSSFFVFPSWPNGDRLVLFFLLLAKNSGHCLPKERKVVSSYICFVFLVDRKLHLLRDSCGRIGFMFSSVSPLKSHTAWTTSRDFISAGLQGFDASH
jgi:hypothetical protein